MILLVTTHHY